MATNRGLYNSTGGRALYSTDTNRMLYSPDWSTVVTAELTSYSSSVVLWAWPWRYHFYLDVAVNPPSDVSVDFVMRITNSGTTSAKITGYGVQEIQGAAEISFDWEGGIIPAGDYKDVAFTLTIKAGAVKWDRAGIGLSAYATHVYFEGGDCHVLYGTFPTRHPTTYCALCSL